MRSGIDLKHLKPSVRPQDDLYRHVNGTWIDSAEIPADRSSDGAFYRLYEQAELHVRQIIEDLSAQSSTPKSIPQKIGDLYRSFMDETCANTLGLEPVANYLAKALAVKDASEFHKTLGEFESLGLGGLFYQYITTDNMDSTSNIIYVGQSGLSLPDEAYYREEEFAEIRTSLLTHIEKMFTLAKIANPADHAKRIFDLETQIASHHWDQVRDRDATLTYNKMTMQELRENSTGLDWDLWLATSGAPAAAFNSIIVRQPSFFTGVGNLLENFDAAAWSSWLAWHLLSGAASYLSSEFINENFAFYGTTLSGTPELKARWKRGVGLVEGSLGEAVGQIYVEKHFPPAAKERMVDLVANLIEAYRIDIAALNWMSPETKSKAFEKLDKFTPKIGYPDKWRDYSKLEISATDLLGNLARISKFNQDFEYAKIGAPVDRTEWLMTPQTVNAYYNPGMNEIVFPAAILQPPFFDLEADDAANYGGIGAVIGHEIGHGFDDQGSKYDGDGNLNNWWTDSDRTEFEKRAAKLIAQYEELRPLEAQDVHVNGALTIGENIGDLGGLTIAIKAYQLSLNGKSSPVIDGLTGNQRLFMGWAQCWRQKMRAEEVRRRVATDPHSPDEFRCNQVVRNLDEFYEAFGITENDGLFLPENERVRIW
ncbi:MAG: peptidase M13 [Actinobacteria bacterium]|nr:peptidase M13 [Actinomycetota bacterium]